jgi:hypothetical protein
VPDDKLLAFIATSVDSVWTLELLLLLERERGRDWAPDELIRELRGSRGVIEAALRRLQGVGLVMQDGSERYRYQAASSHLDELVRALEVAYAATPMKIINAIVAPSGKLRVFSDAFKLKD